MKPETDSPAALGQVGRICRVSKRIVTPGACGISPCQCDGVDRRNRRGQRAGSARQRVWDSHRWRTQTRPMTLARDDYTCQRCGYRDATGRSLIADHVVKVEELVRLGRDPFDVDECQTLCQSCSGAKDGAA